MGALDAHTTMSTQALNSVAVQDGMTDILLNHAGLRVDLLEDFLLLGERRKISIDRFAGDEILDGFDE